MPLLLDKLAAAGGPAKRDTLETLSVCLPVYGKAATDAHAKQLWEGLKIEVRAPICLVVLSRLGCSFFFVSDFTAFSGPFSFCWLAFNRSSMQQTTRRTCSPKKRWNPCSAFSMQTSTHLKVWRRVSSPIASSNSKSPKRALLSRPRRRSRALSVHVVSCTGMSGKSPPERALINDVCPLVLLMPCAISFTASTSYFALYAALDQLLRMFKDPAELSIRASILSHVALLFSALRQVYNASAGSASAVSPSAPNPAVASATSESLPTSSNTTASEAGPQRTYEKERPLDSFRDELLSALANGLRSTGYRASALEAFVNLCHIPGFLEMGEITFMAEAVNQLLIMPEADDVRRVGCFTKSQPLPVVLIEMIRCTLALLCTGVRPWLVSQVSHASLPARSKKRHFRYCSASYQTACPVPQTYPPPHTPPSISAGASVDH